jgi:mannose-1-phosphate guanylyltransferase
MSRFKELNRIEDAIKHKNKNELLWSIGYCQNRLDIATMKEHKKHWNKLIKRTKEVLNEIEQQ